MLTDERIYELWREANDVDPDQMRFSIAFARLVEQEAARQEREACAKVCEAGAEAHRELPNDEVEWACNECAAAEGGES